MPVLIGMIFGLIIALGIFIDAHHQHGRGKDGACAASCAPNKMRTRDEWLCTCEDGSAFAATPSLQYSKRLSAPVVADDGGVKNG